MSGQQESAVVECEEVLDVSLLEEYKILLERALDQNQPITINASAVERVDGAALQLLYTFVKKVEERGLEVNWVAPSESICRAAELAGLRESLRIN